MCGTGYHSLRSSPDREPAQPASFQCGAALVPNATYDAIVIGSGHNSFVAFIPPANAGALLHRAISNLETGAYRA